MKAQLLFVFLLLCGLNSWSQDQIITTTGTWTCPAGVTSVKVEAWGGGGGGGGTSAAAGYSGGGGAGGGAQLSRHGAGSLMLEVERLSAGYGDAEGGKATTETLIAGGADVIFGMGDGAVGVAILSPNGEARRRGSRLRIVGQDVEVAHRLEQGLAGADVGVEQAHRERGAGRRRQVEDAAVLRHDVVGLDRAEDERALHVGIDDRPQLVALRGREVTLELEYISDARMADLLASHHMLIAPYRSATQSGVISLAFEAARPVVVTDVGGLAEFVQDGVNGVVCEPGSACEFASAVARAWRMYPVLQRNAHDAAASWDDVAREYLA